MALKLRVLGVWSFCLLLMATTQSLATTATKSSTANLCINAAVSASRATGVPLAVLRAITLTETGRALDGEMQPWPWTVNMEGEGRWFDDRMTAQAYSLRRFDGGARSFDIGCFQINYRWHGKAFSSIEAMFDPDANALYAALFLKDLYGEFGDWVRAAGAYHSRTPKHARRYEVRFEQFLEDLSPLEEVVAVATKQPTATPKPNSYPLIQFAPQRGGLASLVPLGATRAGRLIDIAGQ